MSGDEAPVTLYQKQSELACVAQLVEWRSPKPKVAGSIPAMRALMPL
jgi:hypothetical protein